MNGTQPMWTLLYDGECALCRMLAGLLSGPVMAWQEAGEKILRPRGPQDDDRPRGRHSEPEPCEGEESSPPVDIGVADLTQDPPVIVTGPAAWEILTTQEPGLRKWQWIAGKLGMSPRAAAATLRNGAHLARRICRQCGPRSPLARAPMAPNPLTRLPEQLSPQNQGKEET